jgi:hypothetical protein
MEPTRSGNHAASRTGSSSIGVAQEEKAQAFPGKKGAGQFQCTRHKTAYVNHDYFYLEEAAFGPLFIQVCRYAPGGASCA